MSGGHVNHGATGAAGDGPPTARAYEAAFPAPPWPHRPRAPAVAGDGAGLLLGLYLILLAFFVMLTALSHREESRARLVLASLYSSFPAHAAAPEALPYDPGREPSLAGAEVARLDRLLADSLPLRAAASERSGDRLTLRLSADAVFAPGSTAPRPSSRVLLGRLADLLAAPPAGQRVEAVVTVGTPDVAAATPLAALRASALAATLVELGAPAARFAVGLGEARPGEVAAALTVRPIPEGGDVVRP
ncbi:MAG TPA: hypothetical protein VFG47_21830 [Geminicoccaceae bacterium]|nr:hypothetical protein [Geminicoccaceae bacterium]